MQVDHDGDRITVLGVEYQSCAGGLTSEQIVQHAKLRMEHHGHTSAMATGVAIVA
jgi:hypothetical protein